MSVRFNVLVLSGLLLSCSQPPISTDAPPSDSEEDAGSDAGSMARPFVDGGLSDAGDGPDGGDAGVQLTDAGPLDAGRTDAGTPDASTPNPLRFQTPVLDWGFVPIPDSRCANGSTTGVGVNLNPTSDTVLIYFVGGGACWNLATCGVGTSANIRRGYGASEFAADGIRNWSMFSRTELRNPFRDMNFVIVPYCTADVHSGNRVATYDGLVTMHHLGAQNVDVLLPRLLATFPSVRRVVLVGSSAGGFGAQLNAPKFIAAFPNAQIDVLADSAQLVNPEGGLLTEWAGTWAVQLPPACVGCTNDFSRYLDYLLTTYPRTRFGLLASMRDSTLTPFFNFGVNVQAFANATRGVLDRYDLSTNGTYFARPGIRHTWLEFVTQVSSGDNATTFDWVAGFLRGDLDRRRP